MGEMPLMTPSGSFVITGAERVIVSNCTVRRVGFEASTHANARPCIRTGSSRTAVPGLKRSLTPTICCMCIWTARSGGASS